MARTIVVFGATGNVGAHVLQGILRDAAMKLEGLTIRAVTRDPDALRARLRVKGCEVFPKTTRCDAPILQLYSHV